MCKLHCSVCNYQVKKFKTFKEHVLHHIHGKCDNNGNNQSQLFKCMQLTVQGKKCNHEEFSNVRAYFEHLVFKHNAEK